MKNLKISVKLIVSFVIVSILTVIVGIIGIVGMAQVDASLESMYSLQTEPLPALGKSVELLQRQRANMREYIIGAALNDREIISNARDRVEEQRAEMRVELPIYRESIRSDDAMALFDEAVSLYETSFTEAMNLIYEGAMGGQDAAALEQIMREYTPATNKIVENFDICLEMKIDVAYAAYEESSALYSGLLILIIVVLVVVLVASMILALYIAGIISKPVITLAGYFSKAGKTGELTVSSEEKRVFDFYSQNHDEIGQMILDTESFIGHVERSSQNLSQIAGGDLTIDARVLSDRDTIGISLRDMVANLGNMFKEINTASGQVTSGSSQISDGAQALASGSTEQAATLEQLSASIADVSDKTRENAIRTSNASKLADTIMQNAEKGSVQMKQMITAVDEINQANQDISRVIKAIDDIAFQTNILALNAAVEAARAGAAGKGFAVVAEEVRNLAAKSAESAKETSNLIANSKEKAELGTQIANETAVSLTEIVSGINESSKIIAEIAHSSEQQNSAIGEINVAIGEVTQVVQQNSATAEESAAASEEMSGQANVLEGLISQFKL
ncbi:MAG: methyl-accepting chemotaxis protein [Oscillospiraceae bacterium]|nr:methyl-accepting chemotaxis protein [Oscillospiraceae bacterium]